MSWIRRLENTELLAPHSRDVKVPFSPVQLETRQYMMTSNPLAYRDATTSARLHAIDTALPRTLLPLPSVSQNIEISQSSRNKTPDHELNVNPALSRILATDSGKQSQPPLSQVLAADKTKQSQTSSSQALTANATKQSQTLSSQVLAVKATKQSQAPSSQVLATNVTNPSQTGDRSSQVLATNVTKQSHAHSPDVVTTNSTKRSETRSSQDLTLDSTKQSEAQFNIALLRPIYGDTDDLMCIDSDPLWEAARRAYLRYNQFRACVERWKPQRQAV
ncbi:hypothetical protein SCP_0704090 [Sparassis crispa]|uniref:Uncharacterized protein n=1 Tax=Sparassis crispa TaxID=139825 RepID=A0A401GSQ5_9APHY|nr:hypothetical protein SCP_0704090 [Sparassis crispa]GBE85223.1 hypothetical protein SCP_0704090 [Sparassis crispa]